MKTKPFRAQAFCRVIAVILKYSLSLTLSLSISLSQREEQLIAVGLWYNLFQSWYILLIHLCVHEGGEFGIPDRATN